MRIVGLGIVKDYNHLIATLERNIRAARVLENFRYFAFYLRGHFNFADIEDWNVAETEGWKVVDTIFRGLESCRHYIFEEWKVADKTYTKY